MISRTKINPQKDTPFYLFSAMSTTENNYIFRLLWVLISLYPESQCHSKESSRIEVIASVAGSVRDLPTMAGIAGIVPVYTWELWDASITIGHPSASSVALYLNFEFCVDLHRQYDSAMSLWLSGHHHKYWESLTFPEYLTQGSVTEEICLPL
jgi:hypothetical protein